MASGLASVEPLDDPFEENFLKNLGVGIARDVKKHDEVDRISNIYISLIIERPQEVERLPIAVLIGHVRPRQDGRNTRPRGVSSWW